MVLFLLKRKIFFLSIIVTVFTGCSKFETTVQGTEGLSSNIVQVCSPGVVSSAASDVITVPNGRCTPSCKSDGSGYFCASQAFVVCNTGYTLATDQTLTCVASGGATTGGTTSGGMTTGGSTTGGSTTGGSTTGGSTTGGSTTGGSTTGGSTTGGSTTGGSTTGGSTTGGGATGGGATGVDFYVDAKAYNPESASPWVSISGNSTTEVYIGKTRLGEVDPPQVKIRAKIPAGTIQDCTSPSILGVSISREPSSDPSELVYKLQMQTGSIRLVSSDLNFCVGGANPKTTLLKISGEVQ